MPRRKSKPPVKRSPRDTRTASPSFLRDFFIPHSGNEHRPHALRPKALFWYGFVLCAIKVITSLVLFFSYPDPALNQTDLRKDFIGLVNAARESQHLRPLIVNDELMRAAQVKADDMMARGYFEHTTPEGASPGSFIHPAVYRYRGLGENLAIDFAAALPAHTALMNSPSHRANLLHPRFLHVGIGVSTGKFNGRSTNIVVELFAYPAPATSQVLGARTQAVSSFMQPLFSLSSWREGTHRWIKRMYLAVLVYFCLSLLLALLVHIRSPRPSLLLPVVALIIITAVFAFAEMPWFAQPAVLVPHIL